MGGSLVLGEIRGIRIQIHYTWLIVFVLVAWSLAAGVFPTLAPGLSTAGYVLLGAAGTLLLFGSVLAHELSHSLVAQQLGYRVRSITLFIFGGVAAMESEARRAADELFITAAGPVMSLLLAGLFFLASLGAPERTTGALLGYSAYANLALAVFNLLPGFPLDGGRILRAALWLAWHDFYRATDVATLVGQGIGWLLVAGGFFLALGGDILGGIWLAFIGWFLNNAAESARYQANYTRVFRGIRVRDVMDSYPRTVPPSMTIRDLVRDHILREGIRAFPVVEDDQLVGIITITDIRHLPEEEWDTRPVGTVMTRMPLRTVGPDADLTAAVEVMAATGLNQLPVVVDGRLVGMVSRATVFRILQVRRELGAREPVVSYEDNG
jgi:Zn-dependent protease